MIVVRMHTTPYAEPLVREAAAELLGYDPGPLFHSCPRCGSVEHGRPYVDAPVLVSIAHETVDGVALTVVAVVATASRTPTPR